VRVGWTKIEDIGARLHRLIRGSSKALAFVGSAVFACGLGFAQAPQSATPQLPEHSTGADIALVRPWAKSCDLPRGDAIAVCSTTGKFDEATHQGALTLSIRQVPAVGGRYGGRVTLLLVPPSGLRFKHGYRMNFDTADHGAGDPIVGTMPICYPDLCFLEIELDAAAVSQLTSPRAVRFVLRDLSDNEVVFSVPMKYFDASFEGPATDPEASDPQSAERQKQLEDRRPLLRGVVDGEPRPNLAGASAPQH